MQEPYVSGGHVGQGVPVGVHTEGKDDGFTQEAGQAAINPMLDQVKSCLASFYLCFSFFRKILCIAKGVF